jgi:hypothetical protein
MGEIGTPVGGEVDFLDLYLQQTVAFIRVTQLEHSPLGHHVILARRRTNVHFISDLCEEFVKLYRVRKCVTHSLDYKAQHESCGCDTDVRIRSDTLPNDTYLQRVIWAGHLLQGSQLVHVSRSIGRGRTNVAA